MLKPLQSYIVLEIEPAEKKIGGFIIPDSKEKSAVGKVVAVGPGKLVDGKKEEITVTIGDRVLYKEYSSSEYKDGDKKYLVVDLADILAVIE